MTANHCPPSQTRGPPAEVVDPEAAGGVGAEHDGRQPARRGVEEAADTQLPADGVEHADVGGDDGDPAGDLVGDEVVATHGLGHVGDPGRRRHRADPGRRRPCRFGQRGRLPEGRGARGDAQQVGAEGVELGHHVGPARRRDPDDGDHRRDPDGDAERGQRGARAAGAQADRADAQQVGEPQPARPRSVAPVDASAAARASRGDLGAVSLTTRPSSRATRRGARAAIAWSWVMSTIVRPRSWRSASRPTMASLVWLSRFPVGSSARTIAGSPTRARAMATRWRSPPDSAPGRCVDPRREADRVERLGGPGQAPATRHAGVEEAVGDVLQRGQPLDEVELLEHEADASTAHGGEAAIAEAADVDAVDAHATGRRALQGADDVEQRRLARARRPDDGDELALVDAQVEAVERLHRR